MENGDTQEGVNEDEFYGRFSPGEEEGYGPDAGFNAWMRINDASLFTEAALENPVVRAFVDAPFSVNYAQFKSSYREAEYVLHDPQKAMSGQFEGVSGNVGDFPAEPRVSTLVMNHERALIWRITFALALHDGNAAAQIIYKEA